MHVVTKILVVFAAVLCLLLSALTVSYAANAERVRAGFDSERARRIAAETELSAVQTGESVSRANLVQQLESANAALSNEKTRSASLQKELTERRAEVERARAESEAVQNRTAQLSATADTQAQIIQALQQEVSGLRESVTRGSKREVDLTDRIYDLEAQREVLQQTARALQEQLTEIRQQMGAAQSGVATASAAGLPVEHMGPLVRARVTETFKDPAGKDMVTISEGSNRGLKADTYLNVVRDGTFIARLVVRQVEPSQAICSVAYYGVGVTGGIQNNDTVLSSLAN